MRPSTLDEIREYDGEPGVELLGLAAAMLANTRCVCAPETSHRAEVITLRPDPTPKRPNADRTPLNRTNQPAHKRSTLRLQPRKTLSL